MPFATRFKIVVLLAGMALAYAASRPDGPGWMRSTKASGPSAQVAEILRFQHYDRALRGSIVIRRVMREGVYEAELRTIAFESGFQNRKRSFRKRRPAPRVFRVIVSPRSAAIAELPPILIHLRVNQFDLVAGCRLDVRLFGRGVLRPLPDNDFGRYLAERGLAYQLKISRRYNVLGVDCSRPTFGGRLHAMIRTTLIRDAGLDYRDARYGIVLGLLLGNSGYLARDVKERARQLGVLHLFAASGLHLGIFYGCLFWPLAHRLGKKNPWALFPPLVPCLAYLLALDVPVSLLRAFCFLSIHALQSVVHRHVPVRELILNTALVVLALAPHEFFRIGTALSFGAVAGILYFSRILRTTLTTGGRWQFWGTHAAVSLAAGICTVPLIVVFFNQHPALSLAANLCLVPLVGVLLPGIVLTICVALGASALDLIVSDAGASLKFAHLWWPALNGLDVFLILSEILAFVDGWLIPPELNGVAGLRVAGLRVLPLFADLLVVAAAVQLRRVQLRAKRSGVAPTPLFTRLLIAQLWIGVALLGPPGAWFEYILMIAWS